jgi:hypothetical protein
MSVTILKPKVDPEVVEGLRELLKLAESGELKAVVFVADRGPEVDCQQLGTLDRVVVLGNLARLMHRINLAIDKG